jgi:NitT/TauT family transport system substrate-binding protein
MLRTQTRRSLLTGLTLSCIVGPFCTPRSLAAEPPPETTTIRLAKEPAICFAPQYVCEELLRDEGFSNIRYVDVLIGPRSSFQAADTNALARGRIDFGSNLALNYALDVDAGAPIPSSHPSTAAATSCSRMAASAPSAT